VAQLDLERLYAGEKDKPKKDSVDKEPKDYWKDIPFSYANFLEVREFVRQEYIDEKIDESRAYVEAANSALYVLDEPRELLPVAFHKIRRNHADEEGGLKGKTYKLSKKDGFLVHIIPKVDKKKKKKRKKLTDDDIRLLRKKAKARRVLLNENWQKRTYGEDLLHRVLAHIEELLHKSGSKDTLKKYYVAAAQGYLFSLDPHSSLMSRAAWDESQREAQDGSFEGIGAILSPRDDYTVVESPLAGYPAEKAGLRAGDVITQVDGQSIKGMPLLKVVKRIRGPKGEPVVLTVQREGEPDELQVTIVRAHVDIKNVSGRLVEHHKDLGYIKMDLFIKDSLDDVVAMHSKLRKMTDGGALRGLVLDLRGNSGGLLPQSVYIADLFLKKGTIVTVKNRRSGTEKFPAHRRNTWDIPLVVLVNSGSASASEIVASAIQDNKRGLLVGDRTFGKATVQVLRDPLSYLTPRQYFIKLTVSRYYSPSGRTIQVVGIKPDIEVPPEVGGKMPLGYREENLSNYLNPIDSDYASPNAAMSKRVEACAKKRGIAEQIHAADPNPQIKYDYQLMKAADFLECLIDEANPASAKTAI